VDLAQELDRLRRSRRSTRPADLDVLLRRPFPLTIDPRNPLLPAYVSKAIRAIEEVLGNDEDT
jgi:hypothetical protein